MTYRKKHPNVSFTEHAMIRYYERVLEHNLISFFNDFAKDYLQEKIQKLNGNGKIRIKFNDGIENVFVVKNYKVITVLYG